MSRFLYVIHCLDDLSSPFVDKGERFGGTEKRFAAYADHKAYLATTNDPALPTYIKKIAAGPMESDDGKYMIGSCFIVEATRAEAEFFNHNDPFFKTGVWGQISISRYISIPNGIKEVRAEMEDGNLNTIKMVVP